MAERRLFKEYNQLQKGREENPQVVSLQPLDPDNIFSWEAVICKPDKTSSPYYYNGQWKLEIRVDSSYPLAPPKIKFSRSTPIAHPNIDISSGEICLDILKSENWSPAWNLQHLVVAILMLLDDPEPDSPLNLDSANLYRFDKTAFESFAQYTIWKNGNFHSGAKSADGAKELDEYSDEEPEVVEFPEISQSEYVEVNNEGESGENENDENVELIKNVGRQITKEFIDKAYEISHSHQSSFDDNTIDNAKQQITENVNKQVEELCIKSTSPENETKAVLEEAEPIDEYYEQERKNFLDQIDAKIQKITSPPTDEAESISESVEPTVSRSSSGSILSSIRRSGSIKKPSSLHDMTEKPKKSKRKILKKLVKRDKDAEPESLH